MHITPQTRGYPQLEVARRIDQVEVVVRDVVARINARANGRVAEMARLSEWPRMIREAATFRDHIHREQRSELAIEQALIAKRSFL